MSARQPFTSRQYLGMLVGRAWRDEVSTMGWNFRTLLLAAATVLIGFLLHAKFSGLGVAVPEVIAVIIYTFATAIVIGTALIGYSLFAAPLRLARDDKARIVELEEKLKKTFPNIRILVKGWTYFPLNDEAWVFVVKEATITNGEHSPFSLGANLWIAMKQGAPLAEFALPAAFPHKLRREGANLDGALAFPLNLAGRQSVSGPIAFIMDVRTAPDEMDVLDPSDISVVLKQMGGVIAVGILDHHTGLSVRVALPEGSYPPEEATRA